jgi:hypothetical protein
MAGLIIPLFINMDFKRNANTDYIYNTLTSNRITRMSNGKIPKMSPEQAAGLIGSWIIETGDPSLSNLDVVEQQGGAGRGLSQYTGVRRIPYDRARAAALSSGLDPNQATWQMQYFADEYSGKYDQQGRSLVGWTRNLENAPQGKSAAEYADYYTGSAREGRGYFRPGVPHKNKRQKAAQKVFNAYQQKPRQQMAIPTASPKPPSNPLSGIINPILSILGIPSN